MEITINYYGQAVSVSVEVYEYLTQAGPRQHCGGKKNFSNFQTCRAACPPYVVPAFRHKQCMNPASLQFRLSLSRAILSMRISVHYRARRGDSRKTILSRKLICAVILFKHKQLRPRVRTLII